MDRGRSPWTLSRGDRQRSPDRVAGEPGLRWRRRPRDPNGPGSNSAPNSVRAPNGDHDRASRDDQPAGRCVGGRPSLAPASPRRRSGSSSPGISSGMPGGTLGLTRNPVMTGYRQADDGRWDEPGEVEFASGCAMLIRRGLLERLGGFSDEYFSAVCEDVDFSRRARRAGYSNPVRSRGRGVAQESASVGGNERAQARLLPGSQTIPVPPEVGAGTLDPCVGRPLRCGPLDETIAGVRASTVAGGPWRHRRRDCAWPAGRGGPR